MSRELRILVVAIVGVVVMFLGMSALLPRERTVETSLVMPAECKQVAPMFADFNAWKRWSPILSTARADTEVVVEGQPGAVGQLLRWRKSPSEAMLRLVRVEPGRVDYEFLSRLQSDQPFVDYGLGEVRFEPHDGGCRVVWRESGRVPGYLGRWFVWFGAQQKTQLQLMEASLARLRVELEGK